MGSSLPKLAVFFVAATFAVVPIAGAQVSPEVQAWSDGPVRFLLTESDRAAFAVLQSDQEANEFIELFWARRDPDLSTRDNEFKADFDTRVMAADAEFTIGESRGALSPRGRVLVLLGPPLRHGRMTIGEYLARLYEIAPPEPDAANPEADVTMQGVTFNRVKGMADLWGYAHEDLPEGVAPEGGDLTFAFFDVVGDGTYRLQGGIRRSLEAKKALEAMPLALVVNPDLTEAPTFVGLPGVESATEDQLAVLDRESLPWPDDSVALVAQGVESDTSFPVWVTVSLPREQSPASVAVGRITGDDGGLLGSFQLSVSGIETALGTVYEVGLPSDPAYNRLEMALLDGLEPVAGYATDLEIAEPELAESFFSPVFAGAELLEIEGAVSGTPFVFGGYHLIPRPVGRYFASDNLNLFCLVSGQALESARAPEVKVRLRWFVGSQAAPSAPAQEVKLVPAAPGVWVWGTQLPLSALSPGVDYMLKVKIETTDGRVSRTTEIPVMVRADEG